MKKTKIIALLVAFSLCFSVCGAAALTAAKPKNETTPRLQDDFYGSINGEWLSNTLIPEDFPIINTFKELQDNIDDKLRADLDAMRKSKKIQPDPVMQNFVEFYRLVSDYDARNAAGLTQLKPRLARIESIKSLADLNAQFKELMLDGYPTFLDFNVASDADNSTVNILNIIPANPCLVSRSFYEEAREVGERMLEIKKQYALSMFKLAGYSEETAQKHWDNMLALDALIVPLTFTNLEAENPANTHNHIDFDQFANYSKNMDFRAIVAELCGKTPTAINVYNPKFTKAIDKIYNEENIEKIKSAMLVEEICNWGGYLTTEVRELAGTAKMALSGTTKLESPDKAAYETAVSAFNEPIGQYYGKKYLGEAGRADVAKMAKQIIAVYRSRLLKNDWLAKETIYMAVRKLDAIGLHVGWPDKLPVKYSLYKIKSWEQGGNLIDNVVNMNRINLEQNLLLLGKPADKKLWGGISANDVNAFYRPDNNSIYLPAAILNAPFYSLQQSASANLGGIGAIIGHEITHAFDTSGSQYDQNGNLKNWWTDADKAEFEKRTEAMIKLFDGIEYEDIKINGDLTKTENVADAGGISCTWEIVKNLPVSDPDAFFRSWAIIWRTKETREIATHIYLTDPHAPPKLRVNIQLGNHDEFYSFYNIKETDGMYIPPEKRVSIW